MFVLRGLRRAAASSGGGASGLAPEAAGLVSSPATLNASSANVTNISILKYPYCVVDTEASLQKVSKVLSSSCRFALDIEAFCTNNPSNKQLGTISLLQTCPDNEPAVFLIDVVRLGVPTVLKHIGPVMLDGGVQKMMFDCRRDVEAVSTQMHLKPKGVLDTQLFFTAIQWKTKSVVRRSGMAYVLKNLCGVTRQEGDSAVQAAMTLGGRPVWDVRPLPPHFLEYAADDVRHILMLSETLHATYGSYIEPVSRLTAQYVDHYAIERPVEVEADPKAHEVSADWLERFIGPGGKCSFCGARGHVESECFRKQSSGVVCSHCGDPGHMSTNCYKKFPHLLKCELCGQMGHTGKQCFQRNKCAYCGGGHRTDSCHKKLKETRFEEERRKRAEAAEAAAKASAASASSDSASAASASTTTAEPSAATTQASSDDSCFSAPIDPAGGECAAVPAEASTATHYVKVCGDAAAVASPTSTPVSSSEVSPYASSSGEPTPRSESK